MEILKMILEPAYELTTPGAWATHYPRNRMHIVALDEDGYIAQYIATNFSSDDDAAFCVAVKNHFPEIIEALNCLAYCRQVFGSDWRKEIEIFVELGKAL